MTSEEKKIEILNTVFKSKDGVSWNELSQMQLINVDQLLVHKEITLTGHDFLKKMG